MVGQDQRQGINSSPNSEETVPSSFLARRISSVLCSIHFGVLNFLASMQRWTARFLLFFALIGTFTPVALRALSAPPRACCVRKSAHPCHHTIESSQTELRSTGCCNRDCGRGVTTSHAASVLSKSGAASARQLDGYVSETQPAVIYPEFQASQPARAPPSC